MVVVVIVDCFTFSDELDMLDLRLNILSDVVDAFVLVEAAQTFQGNPKPLHYQLNRARFAAFDDVVWPIAVPTLPHGTTWAREHYQRNAILQGLRAYGTRCDDIVLISDVDEIPHPDAIQGLPYPPTLYDNHTSIAFKQTLYAYHLNWRHVRPWYGTRAILYGNLTEPQHLRSTLGPRYADEPVIEQGGWSFSSFGTSSQIVAKLKAFSHVRCAEPQFANEEHVTSCVMAGTGILPDDGNQYVWQEIDDSYPAFLRDNLDRYQQWLGNNWGGR